MKKLLLSVAALALSFSSNAAETLTIGATPVPHVEILEVVKPDLKSQGIDLKIVEFNEKGAGVTSGAFGENLVVKGYDLKNIPVGTLFKCNDVILELTQVGKKCHSHCEIFHRVGDCIMPREGVFTKVIHGGKLKVGDEFVICTE